jgi:hypothetical protein
VVLFSDATIVTETPPLRACWSPVGEQAEVPITGNRSRRVLYGALSVRTGSACVDEAGRWNQQTFQEHLRHVRSVWRGWHVVLFVDRGSPHTAKGSRALAEALGIELRFLPTACPELNPLEGLWRYIKGEILANEPTPDIEAALDRAIDEILDMGPTERLQAAGVMSGNFCCLLRS